MALIPLPLPTLRRRAGDASGVGSRRRRHVAAIALGLVLASASPSEVRAQADETIEVVDGFDLTPEQVAKRLEQVRGSTQVTGDLRERAITNYEKALQDLDAAAASERKAQAFEQSRVDAPRTLSELQRELARATDEPDVARNVTPEELSDQLRRVEADLEAARETLKKVEGEQDKRSRRKLEAPRQAADVAAQIAEIDGLLRAEPPPTEDEAAVAERTAMLSRQRALAATLDATEKELASYDARRDLLAAKRDQTLRRIARFTDRQATLQERLAAAHTADAEKDAERALEDERAIERVDPVLRPIAARNAELAKLRSGGDGLPLRIEAARAELARASSELERFGSRFSAMQERARVVGFTPAVGLLLRKERASLPSLTAHLRASRERQADIGAVQLELIELEEARDRLADVDALAQTTAAQSDASDQTGREHIERTARELYLTQRGYLDSVIRDYDDFFTTLVELDARERDLIDVVRKYGLYIDENVLWIRGSSVVGSKMALGTAQAAAWLTSPTTFSKLADGINASFTMRPVTSVFLLLGWTALFLYRRRIDRRLADLCPSRAKALGMSMAQTAEAVILVAMRAAVWPAALYTLSFLIAGVEGASGEYGQAVGVGLTMCSRVLFGAEFLRGLCKPGGPGEMHFGWNALHMRTLRRGIASATAVVLPAIFVTATLFNQSNDLFKASLGRLTLMIGTGWAAFVVYRTMHPSTQLLEGLEKRAAGPWSQQLSRVLHLVAAALPAALFVMAATGYDFAASSLAVRLGRTGMLLIIVMVARAFAVRWLTLTRRRLALRQAWEKRAARAQAEEKQDDSESVTISEADALDLGVVNTQTRRLVATAVAASLLIGTFAIWYDVLPALRVLERIDLWEVTRETTEVVKTDKGDETRTIKEQRPITAAHLLKAMIIVLLAAIGGRNIPGFLEMTVLQQLPFDAGLRYAITSVSRYLIAVLGTVLAVGAIGVNWSSVQWLVAAMTVGLGFGLQEIFANFVAGLIVLFERPIRVGDFVTLGTSNGTVAKIRMRATTIVDADRKELIVPNKEFITGQLVNWTLSDQVLRLVVPVGIAYGADTEHAEKLLLEAAQQNEYVVDDPPPTVMFNAFGESALDLQLRVFVADMDHLWRARHSLCMAIDKAFRKEKIEMSFPQRDLHIRSVSSPIEISLRSSEEIAAGDTTSRKARG